MADANACLINAIDFVSSENADPACCAVISKTLPLAPKNDKADSGTTSFPCSHWITRKLNKSRIFGIRDFLFRFCSKIPRRDLFSSRNFSTLNLTNVKRRKNRNCCFLTSLVSAETFQGKGIGCAFLFHCKNILQGAALNSLDHFR